MTKATEIRPATNFAATTWTVRDDTHIRFYTQYIDGGVRESRWDPQTGWTGGTAADTIIPNTYANTALTVINRDSSDGKKVHLYYTWQDFTSGDTYLGEICRDSGGTWSPGSLNKAGIKVTSNSGLAACADVMGDRDITVLYYRYDFILCEAVLTKGAWIQRPVADDTGHTIENKTGFLQLAAVTSRRPPGDVIQAYCIATDQDIGEFCTTPNGTWFNKTVSYQDQIAGEDRTHGVAAYSEHGTSLKIYYVTPGQNGVTERTRAAVTSSSWGTGVTIQDCYPSAGVVAVGVSGPEPIRLYAQDKVTNQIQEFCWVKDHNVWWKGKIIPTGKVE